MSELKACPFCGKLPEWSDYYHCYRCANLDCMCDCHSYVPSSKENQLEQWNTRPLEDALLAELAAKDAEIERLRDALQERKPIPVSERLPNISERVYVAMKNGWQCIATYYGDYWKNDCGEKIYNVTHWMPLPPAPHIFKGVER